MTDLLTILALAFVQSVSFSVVSRSRNRNNLTYHLIAATFSNGIWFLTFRQLVLSDMDFVLFIPYCIGTVAGSLSGVKVSMWIEKIIGAEADGHLEKKEAPAPSLEVEELKDRYQEVIHHFWQGRTEAVRDAERWQRSADYLRATMTEGRFAAVTNDLRMELADRMAEPRGYTCLWCGKKLKTKESARKHTTKCLANPLVQDLAWLNGGEDENGAD